ncbi:MAG: hypothetical protein EOM13_10205 [Clostridia bacterium]|nr:hypothetical protein [Clostridia bacterium]
MTCGKPVESSGQEQMDQIAQHEPTPVSPLPGTPSQGANTWQPPVPPVSPDPSYQAAAPGGMPPMVPLPKKRRTGCLIVIIILLILLLAIAGLAAMVFGLFGPKNLGVEYTEADYQSAMEKIGTEIIFDGQEGDNLRELTLELKEDGTQYPVAEFDWQHDNFQRRSFELTPEEATALCNEIAPAFYWFERTQVDILPGGIVEASGTLRLRKALQDHYPELIDEVPFPIFRKVNLYARGGIEIRENSLDLAPDTFRTGPIEGISTDMLDENAHYFEPLYTSIPGLVIHSLEVTDEGTFAVDATIPQRTTVTRRQP